MIKEWISVKDRLPHRRQRVLVSSEDGYDMAVLFYFGKDEDDLLEWSVIETICPVDISYWMPLPDTPK